MFVRRTPRLPVNATANNAPVFNTYLSSLQRYKTAYATAQVQLAALRTTVTALRQQVQTQQEEVDIWKQRADAATQDLRLRVLELSMARESQRDAELDREHMRERLLQGVELSPWPIPPIPEPEDVEMIRPPVNQADRDVRNLARMIRGEQRYTIGITPEFSCNCAASSALKRLYQTRTGIFQHQSDAGTQTQVTAPPESSEDRGSGSVNWRWFAERFRSLTGASGAVF